MAAKAKAAALKAEKVVLAAPPTHDAQGPAAVKRKAGEVDDSLSLAEVKVKMSSMIGSFKYHGQQVPIIHQAFKASWALFVDAIKFDSCEIV